MLAICPNGKKVLFLTEDVEEISSIIRCTCFAEVHSKKDMVFNPSEEFMKNLREKEDEDN